MYKFIIKLDKIPSLNIAYKIGKSGSKSWIYLNPIIIEMQKTIIEQISTKEFEEYFSVLRDIKYLFKLEIIYVIKENFFKRDTTNLTKHVEDAISKATKINDVKNIQINTKKVLNDISKEEFIIVVIQEEKLDNSNYLLSLL